MQNIDEEEEITIVIKNLDDNSTMLFSNSDATADIPYNSIARNE